MKNQEPTQFHWQPVPIPPTPSEVNKITYPTDEIKKPTLEKQDIGLLKYLSQYDPDLLLTPDMSQRFQKILDFVEYHK